ncbi:DUF4258 domain-containing protein [Biomaibacter acetigenes]|uniref:DUF4258 domain-containing protein n=1 Tax=Biomaibacter acetigenes TaxID=2316383 RepID=UPI00319DB0BC
MDDYPFPSCLILGYSNTDKAIHVVCALGQDYVWMITAYYPDNNEWLEDLKTRRRVIVWDYHGKVPIWPKFLRKLAEKKVKQKAKQKVKRKHW